jgi:SAM-dependent methyltransferase
VARLDDPRAAVQPGELERLLRCPRCRARVVLDDSRVECAAGHAYPVVDGVPRLVERPWDGGEASLADATSQAFGRQWTTVGRSASASMEDLALHLPAGWELSAISGLVLDAGCGMGRYAGLVARLGARAIGMDVSESVATAASLWPGPAFVQADLVSAPFEAGTFDVVLSFGVLHHLPDPVRGLRACFDLVKPGGLLLAWVYSEHRTLPRLARLRARALVRGRPWLVRPLSWAAAVSLLALRRLPGQPRLPFYAGKSLRQLRTDCHDALVAPREVYPTSRVCRTWLAGLDASDHGVELRRDGSGWLLWARR